jgi:hypothetical protein
VIAYTLMRKAMIATESGDPGLGFGIANSALSDRGALTPRLRAVILRQRSYSNAALGDVLARARDSEEGGHRGYRRRAARGGGPGALLHARLRGHGSVGILGPPRARQDGAPDPGEEPD